MRQKRTIVRKMRTKRKRAIDWLLPKVRVRVLALLLPKPSERWHLRDLARATGLAVGTVRREVEGLVAAGIVQRIKDGNRTYFQAQTRSPLYPELLQLLLKTAGLADVLREALEPLGTKVRVAFVYGSLAKGDETAESDIDLMVLGNAKFAKVVEALGPVRERLGREINPTVYPVQEFRQKAAADHHFVTSVLRGEKLFVIGGADELERVAGQRLAEEA